MHVSTEAGARIIAKARYDGRKVFGETCPQYMFLNAGQMDLPGMHGAKLCCSPPLRDRASQEEIWRCLQNGTFQVYSSDHAPYRFDETGKLARRAKARNSRRSRTACRASSCVCRCCSPKDS